MIYWLKPAHIYALFILSWTPPCWIFEEKGYSLDRNCSFVCGMTKMVSSGLISVGGLQQLNIFLANKGMVTLIHEKCLNRCRILKIWRVHQKRRCVSAYFLCDYSHDGRVRRSSGFKTFRTIDWIKSGTNVGNRNEIWNNLYRWGWVVWGGKGRGGRASGRAGGSVRGRAGQDRVHHQFT